MATAVRLIDPNAALLRRSLAIQSVVSRAALPQQQPSVPPRATAVRRAYATWSDVAPRGWTQHGGFRVMQQRGADVDPMTVVYTLMGASAMLGCHDLCQAPALSLVCTLYCTAQL